MKWFICLRKSVAEPTGTASIDDHLAWMKTQHEAGSILMSGPASGAEGRMGVYIIRSESMEAARAIASRDPVTECGNATFELLEWHVHQIMGIGEFSLAGLNPTAG